MIIGAGYAGLIAAHAFPGKPIYEAQPEPREMHKALLRFRSDAVSQLTGIEFRAVTVRKGVWLCNKFCQPDIRLANMYSQKCLGELRGDRSIWSVEPVTRYIAPETLYEQMVENVGARIYWDSSIELSPAVDLPQAITTAPLPVTLDQLNVTTEAQFHHAPITVIRFRVPRCDLHQTVYFPTARHTLYRASITSDLLIAEFAGEPEGGWASDMELALNLPLDIEPLEEAKQSYGKIAPIDETNRRAILGLLTTQHNVYSIGRFATWRNILLDDVVHDCGVVKRLMRGDLYEQRLAAR